MQKTVPVTDGCVKQCASLPSVCIFIKRNISNMKLLQMFPRYLLFVNVTMSGTYSTQQRPGLVQERNVSYTVLT